MGPWGSGAGADFLSGPVVKTLPSNAGNLGSVLGGEYAMGQLSPMATREVHTPQIEKPLHHT